MTLSSSDVPVMRFRNSVFVFGHSPAAKILNLKRYSNGKPYSEKTTTAVAKKDHSITR